MASSTDVYVFGDQSTPVLDKLQALLRVKDNALLTSFLGEAFLAVRHEIVSLSSIERKSIPEAESLSLLLEGVRRSEPHAALDSAFVCIYEIGYYIDYLARSDKQHPLASPSFLLGICTGSIAAAAVSCAKDVFEISKLGVEAATVAFRLGMHVRRRSENLGYSTPSSWSMILSSNQEELVSEALQELSKDKNLTSSTRPYISAVGPGFTTISGPPSILESLKALDTFSGKRLYPAPIYGPYHNALAYSESSLEHALASILEDAEFLENKMLIPIISCASGSRLDQLSFGSLLKDVLSSALSQQIRMDLVTDAVIETVSGTDATLIPVNAQTTVCSLADWLAKRGATTRIGPTLESLVRDQADPQVAPGDENKIAIIGFSGRFPEADNLDEFWDLLIRGLDVHKPVPEERFARDHYDPTGQRKNTSQVQYGCWLKSAGYFDTQFFHMSPKEAMQTDPAQRLALLTAYEALEMAGVVPDRTPSTQRNRVGVYYGTTSNDWGEVNSSQDVDTYYIPGANRAFIPGRVNYFFKFTGPSIAVDTACSSSLAAINLAITSLKNRDCDTAIAGGTNVMTNPDNFAGLDRGHFLSRTGNCKAFDDGADGYCRADGIGTLILKRLPDAIADSDPIFGVILGAASHTGQGAQETAMANGYYKSFSSFRSDIHQLDSIATLQGLPSVLPLIHGTTPVEDLSAVVVQLGTCIIQIALARFWVSLGITPQYAIGHSLGEYAALQIAGVLSVNDAIFLCGHRAALLDKKCTAYTHGMVAVKAAADDLRQQISSDLKVEIACVNGTEDTVLSGPNADIESLCGKLTQAGYKLHKLEIPFAFHSSQVDPILDDLEELASQVEFHEPKLPIVSPLLRTLLTGDTLGPQYIRRHCRETVDFLGAIKMAEAQGIMDRTGMCIEIGAHPILTRMVKSIIGQEFRCLASLRRKEDHFKTLADSLCALHLAGFSVNWDEYHRDFASSRNVLQLPKYSWQLANYWMHDSVHNVIEQVHGDKRSSITVESDMHDASLLTIAQNHRVNGLTMAPSTLFADIAFTLAKHLIQNHGLDAQTNLPSINNMAVEKALIVGETGPQLFRASLDMDWTSMHGSVRIFSVNASGKQTTLHAVCDVAVENPSSHRESWQSHAYLIQRGITQLVKGAGDGTAHTMRRGLLYKIFSNSVQYGSAFQGIEQVWFDSEGLEGTGKVFMPSGKDTFALNPYCCDSLGHITGFIMNCSDSLDLDDHVYINHGWRSLRLVEPYQCDVQYQTYVKMQALGSDDSTYSGDVHVLRDGRIIGICGGVTFKKVARKVLEMLLPKPSGAKAKSAAVKHTATEPVRHAVLTPPSTTGHSVGTVSPPEPTEPAVGSSSGLIQKALEIIADEIGVDMSQLTDSILLADLGVDSLMSLTILGNFREELDLDIPAAQFYEFSTVQDLKSFLGANDQDFSSSNSEAESSASSAASTSPSDHGDDPVEDVKPVVAEIPRSTSTILQGTKHCSRTLFLFPDGAGSATSYVTLPSISPDMRVIGLNSPYLTKPHEFNCALQDITGSYLNEVRRRQPQGPYHLAGWSAGGVSAFDAARQLVSEGEVVESLILIDSPNPVGLGKLPKRMYDFLEKSGIFGAFEMGEEAQAPPDWLFQHFCVFIEALDRYVPEPFEHGMAPKTTIIWAADGVCKNPDDPRPEAQPDDPRGMNWLLNNREDFGPNGWDEFIGPGNISTMAIENANHFTMMREPIASALCAKIREVMGIN
ncbi:Aflatoxin biosynthesis polyketide synthase [Fusarium oxysporum f. sp. cubense race 1]|uniref:Aflatoxin biosynthesis polyketide synthase n=1 Tax=Fusarium oxysporum f. sp. cubense (strain race 1) TaxID=1229664 RepID=N4U9Q8_FUSC1|nr:Aflatoxin biosynthesis polyketide synthase [Fusarium oxysporum f. sp. cubense race 1]